MAAFDAEFRVLRAEIGRLIDHQKDLHTLSYVSLAALLGFIGVLANKVTAAPEGLAAVLLLVPLLTPQFALTASDLSRRILQLAEYIDQLATNANEVLSPLRESADDIKVWDWERWKLEDFKHKSSRKKRTVIFLEKSRWLALAFPGALGVGSYLVIDSTPLGDTLEWVLFGAAVVVLLYSVITLLVYQSEVKGISLSAP